MRGSRTWVIAVLGALVLLAGSLSSARAERRVALVIGNASYRSMTVLKNPRADATDIAAALRDLGFEVMLRTDVERGAVGTTLKDFSRMVAGADVALFYYAGHALEFRGQYFLVPIDAALEDGDALKYDMLSAEDVRDLLGRARGVRLMILDACRNDPLDAAGAFPPEAARAVRRDALVRALESAPGGQGMVTAYAAAPLDVAEDGKARNSPFTRALLTAMRQAELEVRPMFQRVSREVYDQTKGRLVPEISAALKGPFVLNRAESPDSVWLRIRLSSDPRDFRDFLARFPSSEHAPDAARRRDVLERAQRVAEQRRREEEAQRRAEAERLLREEAERRAAAARAEQARQALERRRAACAAERGQIDGLQAAGRRADLDRLKAESACPEESGPRVDAALAALAEAARRDAAERQAAEQHRRAALCADEARRIGAAAAGAGPRAGLDALGSRLQCEENAPLLAAGLQAASAREAEAREAAAGEAAAREAAAREAAMREAAVREAAVNADGAGLQRLEGERDRAEQACARDRGEFERLRRLGAGGRDRLERLAAATACEELKPLVVAALGAGAQTPANNAPDQIRRASGALHQMGCFDGGADDGSLESVHAALKRYYVVRDEEPASLDVDEAVVKRLDAEGPRRVCPLQCPAGEEAHGEHCLPGIASRPQEREGERPAPRPAAFPAVSSAAPEPAPKPAVPKPAAARTAARPAPAEAPKPTAVPRPPPPVASAPPAARLQPSIILGN